MQTCISQVKPGCAAITNTRRSQGLTLTAVSALRPVCIPTPLWQEWSRLECDPTERRVLEGLCVAVNAPAPKNPKSFLLRTHWPELVTGPLEPRGDQEEQSIVISGAYLESCSSAALADVLCPQPPHTSQNPQGCYPCLCWTLLELRAMAPMPGCWGHAGQATPPEGHGADP